MKKTVLIGIAGGSASGKTTFINKLKQNFTPGEVGMISQDNYYLKKELQHKDQNGIENFDHPTSIDWSKLLEDIESLKNGKSIQYQKYGFNNSMHEPEIITLSSSPVIVIEGIFILSNDKIIQLLDLKIYLEVKEHLKLTRRIVRDKEERGLDIDDVLYRYENHIYPAYQKYIKPSKEQADLIIPNNFHFDKATEVVSAYIHVMLQKGSSD